MGTRFLRRAPAFAQRGLQNRAPRGSTGTPRQCAGRRSPGRSVKPPAQNKRGSRPCGALPPAPTLLRDPKGPEEEQQTRLPVEQETAGAAPARPGFESPCSSAIERAPTKREAAGENPARGTIVMRGEGAARIGHEGDSNPPGLGPGDTRGRTGVPDHLKAPVA